MPARIIFILFVISSCSIANEGRPQESVDQSLDAAVTKEIKEAFNLANRIITFRLSAYKIMGHDSPASVETDLTVMAS